ncbi:hypothetical protein QER60_004450 [Salmonella enterica subsp. enterica serovar Orion]|nr:hypothetical protein [Salmonella enterica subsp. enterica serovar Orion]
MSTDNLLAELTSKTGLTETELNRQALIIGLMALCHPDAIAGDLVSAALTGSYSDSTDKLLTRGDNASDSVLMSMRILLHRLSKGRCEQVPDMRSSYSSGAHPRGTS